MKKIFAILVALMMVISMFGCNKSTTEVQPTTTAPVVETTETVTDETTAPATTPVTEPEVEDTTPEVEEIAIISNEQFIIYLVGSTLTLRIENLADKEATYRFSNFVVDGQALNAEITPTVTVAAGASETIEVASDGVVVEGAVFSFDFDGQYTDADTQFVADTFAYPEVV